ncbi:hypothetical protein FRC00_003019 [Tulasnella sp. 408]|nr:hypothetical protein FRC00_003019 [Tulasnella sp. 408]
MPLNKKRKGAQEREYDKRRLKGWTADFNPGSAGSDTEYTDDFSCATDEDAVATLLLELSGSEDEESDGSDLLQIKELVVNSDDWDPTFQPLSGICLLFTRPPSSVSTERATEIEANADSIELNEEVMNQDEMLPAMIELNGQDSESEGGDPPELMSAVDSAFELLTSCINGLSLDIPANLGGLHVLDRAMRNTVVADALVGGDTSAIPESALSKEGANRSGSVSTYQSGLGAWLGEMHGTGGSEKKGNGLRIYGADSERDPKTN